MLLKGMRTKAKEDADAAAARIAELVRVCAARGAHLLVHDVARNCDDALLAHEGARAAHEDLRDVELTANGRAHSRRSSLSGRAGGRRARRRY